MSAQGIVYLTVPAAQAAQDSVTAALGYPRCERINGQVIGSVPACLCVGDGKGANVHVSCPYATRRQTDVALVTGPLPATPIVPLPALLVDGVMASSAPCIAALPAITAAVPLTLAAAVAVIESVPIGGE